MEIRKTLAFSEPLAPRGVVIEEGKLQRRLRERKRELLSLVPSLRNLKASVLQFAFGISDAGVELQAELIESPQASLSFGGRHASNDDLYLQDLHRVRHDFSSKEDRLYAAVHAPLSTEFNSEQVELRRYASRVSHKSTTRESDSLDLPFGPLPQFMPLGSPVLLQVRVNGLTRQHADVEVADSDGLPVFPGNRRPRKLRLLRVQEHRQAASGAVLQEAMDRRRQLCIKALLLRRWTDGEIAALELQAFWLPAKPSRTIKTS